MKIGKISPKIQFFGKFYSHSRLNNTRNYYFRLSINIMDQNYKLTLHRNQFDSCQGVKIYNNCQKIQNFQLLENFLKIFSHDRL